MKGNDAMSQPNKYCVKDGNIVWKVQLRNFATWRRTRPTGDYIKQSKNSVGRFTKSRSAAHGSKSQHIYVTPNFCHDAYGQGKNSFRRY